MKRKKPILKEAQEQGVSGDYWARTNVKEKVVDRAGHIYLRMWNGMLILAKPSVRYEGQ